MKSAELKRNVEQAIERLAELSDEARNGVIREWLLFQARFHKYSAFNTWLIRAQRPDATLVAGYRRWQELGRQVRKGEKGIAILCPRPRRYVQLVEGPDGEVVEEVVEDGVYFVTGYVFDVAQTEGEPLPEAPSIIPTGDGGAELTRRLEALCAQRGIAVERRNIRAKAYGLSYGGRVVVDRSLSGLGEAFTLAHELAHELAHDHLARYDLPREVREVEAEAVAFVVLAHFGYEIPEAGNYVALWDRDGKILRERMERIASVSREIIEALEGEEAGTEARTSDPTTDHAPDQSPVKRLTRAEVWKRWERACQALASGEYRIQRLAPRLFAVSNGDGREYQVSFEENPLGACSCPDFAKRGGPCKHVAMAVLTAWPQAAERWREKALAQAAEGGG
ncbi:MAG: ArdC-like ssDNA-binding domain-containing protein [Armatimonadota bacterium]|nr:ArdC-like ssDNA-binding domain-containing protein [Armatimonadota bacterium]